MANRARVEVKTMIDEPHVRVIEYRFAPGAETGWHRHGHDYVIVPVQDDQLLLEEPGGGTRTAELRRHQPYARPAGVEHGHQRQLLRIRLPRNRAAALSPPCQRERERSRASVPVFSGQRRFAAR